MFKKEFRRIIEKANQVVDRCYARGVRTFDRSMSELADQRDYVEYARKQVEDEGVTYLGKDFKVVPIFLIIWILLMRIIDTATAGALCEASGMIFASVFFGTAIVAVFVGFILSVLIDKIVAWQNVEECGGTLCGIYSCEEWLAEKRQAVKEKSVDEADSDAPVDEADSDAPVDDAVSDVSADEADSDAPVDE